MNMKPFALAAILGSASLSTHAFDFSIGVGGNPTPSQFIQFNPLYTDYYSGLILDHTVPGFATEPGGTVGNYMAGTPGLAATITVWAFDSSNNVSFLWGSPSSTDWLAVRTLRQHELTTQVLNAADFGLNSEGYVHLTLPTDSNESFYSLTFLSNGSAFEVANLSVFPVPEPASLGLLLAGLGVLAFKARKQKT